MYNINDLNKALPLIASILGKKYGVQVQIGGDVACTDGKVIRLPTMPLETDENLRNLTRSFCDHEAAHIRDTDFEVLKDKSVTPLVKHIWNVFEDWRVESLLAKRFPGCRKNLSWLIKREFTKKLAMPKNPAMQIINYLLLSVRAWDVPEVERNRDIVGAFFKQAYPVLYDKINALLDLVKAKCKSSKDAMNFAKDVESLLKAEAINLENEVQQQDQNPDKKSKQAKNAKRSPSSKAVEGLQKLLKSDDGDLPKDISKIIAEELKKAAPNNPMKGLSVAVESGKHFTPIDSDDFHKISRASTALHTRLHSLLQSTILVRRSGSSEQQGQGILLETVGNVLELTMEDERIHKGYKLISNVGMTLSYSREHEYEADYFGLKLLSEAGYSPQMAIKFYDKLAKISDNSEIEFFSTHPNPDSRKKALIDRLDEFLLLYSYAPIKRGQTYSPSVPEEKLSDKARLAKAMLEYYSK